MRRLGFPAITILLPLILWAPAAVAETCRSADGGPIGCGDAVTGSIDPAGDTDLYSLEVIAGGVIAIRIAPASLLDPICFQLLGPGGGVIGGIQCGEAEFTVSAGTHTVRVQGQSGSIVGGYGLSIQGVSAALSCAAALSCDQTSLGAIDCLGDTDALTLWADAGEVISIRIAPAVTQCYRLFDPTGAPQGTRQCGTTELTPSSSGAHTLLIAPNQPLTTGAYGLTRTDLTGPGACGPAVSCGQTVMDQISPLGDVDAYAFDVPASGTITVRIGPGSIIAPICFRMFEPDGDPLAASSCDYRDFDLLPGRHRLLFEPSGSSATGDFAFTIEGVSPSLTCGSAIPCGQVVNDQIEQLGDQDAFLFGAEAGAQATIGINGGLILPMCYRLYDPDGAPISGRQCNVTATWDLPLSGIYSIVTEPKNISGTGSYALQLGCQTCFDPDADGVCFPADNCPDEPNPSQSDADGDGRGDACECSGDPDALLPAEIPDLEVSGSPAELSWTAAGGGAVHDLIRGRADQLPVGSGNAETCLASGTTATSALDETPLPSGAIFWYLVRARDECGAGSWGWTSTGLERLTVVCP